MTTPFPHLNPLPLEYMDIVTVNPARMAKHFEQLLETYEQKAYDRGVEDGRSEARKEIRCSTNDYKQGYANAQHVAQEIETDLRNLLVKKEYELAKYIEQHEELMLDLGAKNKALWLENYELEMDRVKAYESGKCDGAKEATDSDMLEDMKRDAFDAGFSKGVEHAEKNTAHSTPRA